MAQWVNTYRPGQIPPLGVIHKTLPGRSIAKAITEIQERAITNLILELSGGLSGSVEVDSNTITLALESPEIDLDGYTGDITLATSVLYSSSTNILFVNRVTLTYEDGVLKSETSASPQTISLGSGLPSGGSAYHVLQRAPNGEAVWDVVRFPE